ncbi:glycosyltransferase family 4 protein [Streptomyces sp. NPDC046862]|uniref:glycosyltransferase family 4 protein n=1 Tax=Streptomyces sp. NPDC046862 TaxID=3154603 RepID=UPI003451F5B8
MTDPYLTTRSIVFILASWQMDAPAGIERATAALAVGLAAGGHRVAIATAALPQPGPGLDGVAIEPLDLPVTFPCDDYVLREAIEQTKEKLQAQLREITARHRADTVVFTDALWGLGRLADGLPDGVRRVLAAHVLPNPQDTPAALARADTVIIPSPVVQAEARAAGWPADAWRVVPNALLYPSSAPPDDECIQRRQFAPVRVLARLGHEKGLVPLLVAAAGWTRRLEVRVAHADFETAAGSQAELLDYCQALASAAPNITLLDQQLTWREVPGWLGAAAAVIVPSLKETFGLVALEAMSAGVPVVSYPVGNLPALKAGSTDAGRLVGDPRRGPDTLLQAVDGILADPVAYGRTSKAMYHLAQDYRPDRIADLFLKAVS